MKNIVSCSFGKDSLAQLIVMKEMGIVIDDVVYCDIRFDNNISGGILCSLNGYLKPKEY